LILRHSQKQGRELKQRHHKSTPELVMGKTVMEGRKPTVAQDWKIFDLLLTSKKPFGLNNYCRTVMQFEVKSSLFLSIPFKPSIITIPVCDYA
tara:strand:- start:237 stop:515 length:279 start_codon:yes stop_codon:yes gene_type:complete